jgi:N-acetylglucosaminyldiphosphoundecaprenol N-acetyl-beta-D-mannosaminyltransferase
MIDTAKKNLLGVMVNAIDRESAADLIIQAAQQRRSYAVSALAVHGVMEGVLRPAHLYRLNHLELTVADGQPVRWALNLIHAAGLKERVYGPSLTVSVLARAEQLGIPVFFYGSTPDVLASLRVNIAARYPGLIIAGTEPSQFGRLSVAGASELANRITQSGAQIVFIGLGCPRQEVWAYEFRKWLKMPLVAVGAAFPFLAGTLRQAPPWMQDHGLEWLFRLWNEPRRLWRRYLLLSPVYLLLMACQWMGFRFHSEGEAPQREILYG